MALSKYNTLALPPFGSKPVAIATSPQETPSRVVLRNVSGSAAAQLYVLQPGDAEVLVLAPGVAVFGVSLTAGAVVSMTQSDALPLGQVPVV